MPPRMGRLTVDELDERTALAYGAVTRGELAELLDDLPVRAIPGRRRRRRLRAGADSRGSRAATRSRVRWVAPANRKEAQTDLMEFVAPPMHRFGYDLSSARRSAWCSSGGRSAAWTVLPAIFLFPIGLFALLTRGNERVAIELLERRGETILIAQGVAPLRGQAGVRWTPGRRSARPAGTRR